MGNYRRLVTRHAICALLRSRRLNTGEDEIVGYIKTAFLGGVFKVPGAIGGAAVTGLSQVKLTEQKLNTDLVLKEPESDDSIQRLGY